MTPTSGGRRGPTHLWRTRAQRQAWWREGCAARETRPESIPGLDAKWPERLVPFKELSAVAEKVAERAVPPVSPEHRRIMFTALGRLINAGYFAPPKPPAPPTPISLLLLCNPPEG